MIHLHGALTSLKICPPVRVLSPTGRDLTDSFPELAAMADVGPAVPTLLDAIVTTDPSTSHAARFARSQLLYRVEAPVQEADDGRQLDQPIQALVLDMVHLDGRRVGDLPYTHRRSLLLERLPDGPHWEVPSHSLRADRHLLAAAADWHTDEIVAKRLDSHYFPGMISPTWLRIPVSSFAARPLAS